MRALKIFLGLLLIAVECPAQSDSLRVLLDQFGKFRNSSIQEKLFVHTDQSLYLTGETMWFKVYSVDATLHRPLAISKVAYLEILDKENKPVLQSKIELANGTGAGALFIPASLSSGRYLFRVYTRWMRNELPDLYYQQELTLINPFTRLGLKPASATEKYDAQFFPEGGSMIAGLQGLIGVRVVNGEGKGVDYRGAVVNENKDTVARFSTWKLGLGRFSFTPRMDSRYTAIIHAGTKVFSVPLPAVKADGYTLHVRDTTRQQVAITAVTNSSSRPFIYFLVHSQNAIAASELKYLKSGAATLLINRDKLMDGISHITVFDDSMLPVCERLYFKNPLPAHVAQVAPTQDRVEMRGKMKIDITSSVRMNLSIGVVRTDTISSPTAPDITTVLFLTSDLRGTIESPEYYLQDDADSKRAADDLMLTQGWSRFHWRDVRHPKALEYAPESGGLLVMGRVLDNVTGTPASGISTYASSPGKSIRTYLSRSNDRGIIKYELKDFFGSRKFFIQTNTELDSTYRFEITSPWSGEFSGYRYPEFDLPEEQAPAIGRRSLDMQLQNIFQERFIKYFQPRIDSIPFYGKPDEAYRLDDYTRFPTMEEVMREYVPGVVVRKRHDGFHFLNLDQVTNTIFRNNPLVLMDGMPVFDIDKVMNFDPRKVQKLDVMTHRYYLGHLSFEGVVSYTTYKGDLADFEPDPKALMTIYDGLQQEREFFVPGYNLPAQHDSRSPDTRHVLYWNPHIRVEAKPSSLEFYVSDVPGVYKITIQGVGDEGQLVNESATFTVTPHVNP